MKKFVAIVLLILFVAPTSTFTAQTRKKAAPKDELPNERFFRKGGRSTKAKVVWDKKVGLTTKDITAKRNLALYEVGGHFDCGKKYGASMGEGELEKCDNSKIADFVWNHWENKAKGYLAITANSVDAVSTSHIFIEPRKDGKWHVAWRIVRHSGEIHDIPDIVQVEKAKPDRDNDPFILILRDREGDQVQTLPWR